MATGSDDKRLIGDDGRLAWGSLGTSAVGADAMAAGSWYKIVAKGATTFGDLAIGEYYYATEATPGAAGDTGYLLTLTNMLDLSGWSLNVSADEVPTTVLSDKYKKYRKGKLDAAGTASFVFIKGVTDYQDADAADKPNGIARYFFDLVEIDENSTVTVTRKTTDPVYLVGYLIEDDESGQDSDETCTLAMVLEVEFYSFELPMNISEPVNMEVPFRLVGDADPILYRLKES